MNIIIITNCICTIFAIVANVAKVSTEHILKQIRTSFGIFCFVALNYCFFIHQTVATCTDKVRASFNFRMECRNGLLY